MTESTDLIYDYVPPLTQLLTLGDIRGQPRRDYLTLGLNAAHIPDLIRMAQDDDLHWADGDSAEVWAPIHAWRALGQLRAVEAIEPLIAHLPRIDEDDDDWAMEEIPHALAGIGEAAIPALALFLTDSRYGLWARITAASSLGKIGEQQPQARDAAVTALVNGLKNFQEQPEELNGFIISYLTDLKAVEVAPLMEQVFAADKADISIQGDWEDTQIELGLLEKRLTPPPHYVWLTQAEIQAEERQRAQFRAQARSQQQAKAKAKAKRKQAKQNRQKQRKKKK